jgi:hydrophobic/amphiphilic exporter-1 (mainly G- bacteria), HAE1 family
LRAGPGAAARNSLGIAVLGGVAVSTVVNPVFIPGLYLLVQRPA